MYENTISNFGNFSLKLKIVSSNLMKNTYFFALERGLYMGPEYVGIKIKKHLAAPETDREQNMSSWATFSPSGDIIQSVLAYIYLAIRQGLLHPQKPQIS